MSSIKILSRARKATFDGVPNFSATERKSLMLQDKRAKTLLRTFRSNENKVGFLIQRAYFQAKGRFFSKSQFKPKDVREAERALGLRKPCNLDLYSDASASVHRKKILELHGWQSYTPAAAKELLSLAAIHSKSLMRNEDILFTLLEYCWRNKTVIPSYTTLENIVASATAEFQQETLKRLDGAITNDQRNTLLSLILDKERASEFTKLKNIKLGTEQRILRENAEILEQFREIFFSALPLIETLDLPTSAVKEYASWIYNSNLSQIQRFKNRNLLTLRLLCFAQDQFFLRQDYAIDAIVKTLRSVLNSARGMERKQREQEEDALQNANAIVVNSAKNADGVIRLISQIFDDASLSDSTQNEQISNLVQNYLEAINPQFTDHVTKIENQLLLRGSQSRFYDYLFNVATTLVKSLIPLVRAVEYDEKSTAKSLLAAISAIKDTNFRVDDSTSCDFMTKKDIAAYQKECGVPQISKYKVIVLSQLSAAILGRTLTLKYSYRYLSDQHNLISDKEWLEKRDEILFATNLKHFVDGKSAIAAISKKLEKAYKTLNAGLANNDFVTINKNGSWKTRTESADYSSAEFIPKLIGDSGSHTLHEILREIDTYSNFSDNFRNYQDSHGKQTADKKVLYAVLMSLGTNIGHTDMAKASGISRKLLSDTEKNWFSSDNLMKANAAIIRVIRELPLPIIYNERDDVLHTSSDGKKVIVAVDSLLANYSYKYYGKEQGINVNSFVDTSQAFFHVNVLSSSDREAAFMMDGIARAQQYSLIENIDMSVHKHSTDTHGYTDAMFAGLHLLDVSFAPRLSDISSSALYSATSSSLIKNSGYLIGPKTQINITQILENWDDILRLMATIKSGRQSASLIFRRLAASARESALYKAIKSLGKLIKSQFIATYLHDGDLRRSIHKQLNRVELGQKFSRALFFGREGKLQVGAEAEILKAMQCKSLLKNVVILWNYLYLSDHIVSLKDSNEIESTIDSISEGSVISWRHINKHGKYDFNHKPIKSFKATISEMKKIKVFRQRLAAT
ncbi:MAG: TnpA family transposase [Pseudohongiellaceae bacterium]|jgi:TnpA family transposase|uniref:Tn3 family transposase n=1 Tax=Zhongshania guokunii TaxID=641783 RepID=A0ABV3U6C8_9GAMM